MMAYRCNPKAWVLATLPRSKKETRTHRKKIQKGLPGKQQDGSFVYGFGNFRVEECILPVFPRHCYCESEKEKKKKRYISFLLTIQTLSKDTEEQFHRPFLPEKVLTVSALQPRSGNSLLHRNASHGRQRTRKYTQYTQAYPMLPEAYLWLPEGWGPFLLIPQAGIQHDVARVSKIMCL